MQINRRRTSGSLSKSNASNFIPSRVAENFFSRVNGGGSDVQVAKDFDLSAASQPSRCRAQSVAAFGIAGVGAAGTNES
jgi:hypothetical protein